MSSEITNHKCPSCTAPLRYDGASGRLVCDYCGSSFSVQEIDALYSEDESAAAASLNEGRSETASPEDYGCTDEWGSDADNLVVYNCPSCGAQLFCDINTAATSCPYCGNHTVIPGKFEGSLKPEYLIPFKLSKDDAVSALKQYYKGKKLLPDEFAEENHIEEIKGVYVPFWLYDGRASADVSMEGTRSTVTSNGRERITVTEYFNIRRSGYVNFNRIPADASSKMPDAHMDAIEPFDYSDLTDFSTAYLPGFLCDKYDQSAEICMPRAVKRAKNTAVDLMKNDVRGYSTLTVRGSSANVSNVKFHYALLPVWMLSTTYNGSSYLFAMNGQTGKLIGDLPVSKSKYYKYLFGIWGIGAAILGGLMFLLYGGVF